MRFRISRLVLVAAAVTSISGVAAAPANASTCQTQYLDKLVCDTVVEPTMATLCNKAKICFG